MTSTTTSDGNAKAEPRRASGREFPLTIMGAEGYHQHRDHQEFFDDISRLGTAAILDRTDGALVFKLAAKIVRDEHNSTEDHGFYEHISVMEGSRSLPHHITQTGPEESGTGLASFLLNTDVSESSSFYHVMESLKKDRQWTGKMKGSFHDYSRFTSLFSDEYPSNMTSHYNSLLCSVENVLKYLRELRPLDRRLTDALQDLREASEEAKDEGFPAPSLLALKHAERLLRVVFGMLPHRLEVYPTPDGEIAIHAKVRRGSSVLILCESDGGVLCLVNARGQHRRKRYRTGDDTPDVFLEDALAEIGSIS